MKFLKKTVAVFLILATGLFAVNTAWAEDAYTVTELTARDAAINEADALLAALLGHPARGTTRAEFVADVAELMQLGEAVSETPVFSDVPATSEYAGYINAAAAAGVVAAGTQFRPGDPITIDEAITIIVNMIGYADYAAYAGGYPNGYRAAAEYAQILTQVQTVSGEITAEDAKILLLNALNSRVLELSGSFDQIVSDETFLMQNYDITRMQGILNETPVNSLYTSEVNYDSVLIHVGDTELKMTDNNYADLLGYNVTAYYDGDGMAVSLTAARNNRVAVAEDWDKAEMSGLNIVLHGEEKRETIRLDEAYVVLYNGGYTTESLEALLEQASGQVEFIDNDRNGRYDVVKVQIAQYIVVEDTSRANELINDKNAAENSIDLSDPDINYTIYDGEEVIRFLDIQEDDVYEVYKSVDGKIITAYKLSERISGVISSTSADGVYIDDVLYETTSYYDTYYADKVVMGTSGTFVLSQSGKLVSFELDATEMKYAYVYRIVRSEEDYTNIIVRMFTEDGENLTLNLADRVRMDGSSYKKEAAYSYMLAFAESELIRYRTDADGLLKYVDTAEEQDGIVTAEKPEDNSLTKCIFAQDTFQYKPDMAAMYPYFNISSTKVFVIPPSAATAEDYIVTGNSFFIDGTYGGMTVYDVGLSGTAGAVVVRSDDVVPEIAGRAPSFVIESLTQEYNEEEEEVMYIVYGWQDSKFTSYYIDDSVAVTKASGETLGFGDVIRFTAENGIIKKMECDLDANENVFAKNNTSTAIFNGGVVGVGYQFGRAYSVEGQWVYMTDSPTGWYDMTRLRNFIVNTNNIAIVNLTDKTIKTGTLGDIKTFSNNGSGGDVLLLRQRDLGALSLIVYTR